LLTRNRPELGWFHISSLVYGASIEIWDWTCPLTPLEDWFRVRAGLSPYQGGFLLHYLDTRDQAEIPGERDGEAAQQNAPASKAVRPITELKSKA
jgi:Protein of Unknown function (DUF2784)